MKASPEFIEKVANDLVKIHMDSEKEYVIDEIKKRYGELSDADFKLISATNSQKELQDAAAEVVGRMFDKTTLLQKELTEYHIQILTKSAINLDVFKETGGFSVTNVSQLPEDFKKFPNIEKELPALCFAHHSITGEIVYQLRPDTPTILERKYLFPKGKTSITVHPRQKPQLTAKNLNIIFVEGTKQSLCAVSNSPEDTLIIGLNGCYGWSSEGVARSELNDIPALESAKTVSILFDADISQNLNVWEAASKLQDHLQLTYGLKEVKILKIPAGRKNGLDDYLATHPEKNRSKILTNLISAGSGKLPAKPKPKTDDLAGKMYIPKQSEFLIYVAEGNYYIPDVEKTSDYLCEKYNFITIAGKKADTLLYWDGRIYCNQARAIIKRDVEALLEGYAKINAVNEILAKIERRNYVSPEVFENVNVDLIPLENGVLNLKTFVLEPHSPKNYFRKFHPIEYDPMAICGTWMQFIEQVMYPEDIPTAQEWFGFALRRKYFIKKALIILGPKNTGKTVYLNSYIGFIGRENISSLSLHKISQGNDFSKLSLKDKSANVYDDLNASDLNDGGAFKVATGGGYIAAEEKFGDCIQFMSYAKQNFATNRIPPVKNNDDDAYYSRWIVFKFDNEVSPEEIDYQLSDKISKENSGILNWALIGLKRIMEKGCFSYTKTPQEVKQIMESSGDVLVQFGNDVLVPKKDGTLSKEIMHTIYSKWAKDNNKPLLSIEQLGRRLNQRVPYIVPKRGDGGRYWSGVALSPDGEKNYSPEVEESKDGVLEIPEIEEIDMFNPDISQEGEKNDQI